MKKSFEITAIVTNGKFIPEVREHIMKHMQTLEGKAVRISMVVANKRRSGSQNSYYWGVVIRIITQWMIEEGNDVDEDEVHEYLKKNVGNLKTVITLPDGTKDTIAGSSTKLGTKEFDEYMMKCTAWAAGFNVIIPMPNESPNYFSEGL